MTKKGMAIAKRDRVAGGKGAPMMKGRSTAQVRSAPEPFRYPLGWEMGAYVRGVICQFLRDHGRQLIQVLLLRCGLVCRD